MTSEDRSLRELVGDKAYETWVDMVRILGPDGRTHRLGPLVAAFLRYASATGLEGSSGSPKPGSVAYSLVVAEEAIDSEEAGNQILDVVEALFADAGVASERVNRRGDPYSIADAAVYEFVHWHEMPWEA